jgi:hypothetical protein
MQTEQQREADKRYRLKHPEKLKEKDAKRYRENRESERIRNRNYYRNNRETQRIRHRNNRHGITQEWFDQKIQEQDGKCAICHNTFTNTPHIDHDHECCPQSKSCDKCRRGLLCEDCNLGLGRFKDDVSIMSSGIQYLNRYKETQ